jgi:hypothetical protein
MRLYHDLHILIERHQPIVSAALAKNDGEMQSFAVL